MDYSADFGKLARKTMLQMGGKDLIKKWTFFVSPLPVRVQTGDAEEMAFHVFGWNKEIDKFTEPIYISVSKLSSDKSLGTIIGKKIVEAIHKVEEK